MYALIGRSFLQVLMSPMPGSLISVSVVAGQKVRWLVCHVHLLFPGLRKLLLMVGTPFDHWQVGPGDELAVIEAMKMRNVLRAENGGIVKSVLKHPGDVLAVDEVIIEYK